jgi:hypothetical protein
LFIYRLATLVVARRLSSMGAADHRFFRYEICARMKEFVRRSYVPFRRFLGDVRREFMQRLSMALLGTLSPYLRGAGSLSSWLLLRASLLRGLWLMCLFLFFSLF